jgi:bifunctional DNA-binding transcriptional regulator/antitoxin component of YhaV-PrlF toxin-antitoxin module
MQWSLTVEPGWKLTLPQDLQARLGAGPGDKIELVEREDGRISIRRVEPSRENREAP